jgi:hypothetical protein
MVSPFTEALGTMDHVPIVSAAVVEYDDPETGEVICLVIHQAIYISGSRVSMESTRIQVKGKWENRRDQRIREHRDAEETDEEDQQSTEYRSKDR